MLVALDPSLRLMSTMGFLDKFCGSDLPSG
jgi:hypothetical protein